MSLNVGNRVPGTVQQPSQGRYTGYNINATAGSRTATNANLARGACLQYDGFAFEADACKRHFALPTTNFNWPVAIVDPTIPQAVLDDVNVQDGVVANLRRGGVVPLVEIGRVQALVKANCTKGQTRLTPTAGQQYLQAFAAGTVDQNNLVLGATGEVVAIADETVDTSAAEALVFVILKAPSGSF